MKELFIRSISGFVYASIILISIFYSPISLFILIFIFSSLAIWEFQRLINFLNPLPILILGLLIINFYLNLLNIKVINIILYSCLFTNIVLVFFLISNKQIKYNILNKAYLTFFYISFSCFFIIQIPFLKNEYKPELIAFFYLTIWTNNSFAYVFGKRFGKKKLIPKISPKKSWEGFSYGTLFTLFLTYVMNKQFSLFENSKLLILVFSICILATFGDLVESYFKRIAEVKDSGSLIPGHGGFYDRMDSVIFTAPFYFILLKIT